MSTEQTIANDAPAEAADSTESKNPRSGFPEVTIRRESVFTITANGETLPGFRINGSLAGMTELRDDGGLSIVVDDLRASRRFDEIFGLSGADDKDGQTVPVLKASPGLIRALGFANKEGKNGR